MRALTRCLAVAAAVCLCAAPVEGQCADGSPPPCRSVRPAASPNSIAVLYFDNLTRDTANAFLAEGLTEELISRLAQVERLQVKSRTAVRAVKGIQEDPARLGERLGVAQLLSGSVLPAGGRVRITVELTRAASGNTIWARSFERPAADLLTVQAEIAESIAVKLGGRVAPAERARIVDRPTNSGAAFLHLLRARYEGSRRTREGMLRSIREYNSAIRLDSGLTLAYVGLTSTYSALSNIYYHPEIGLTRDSLQSLARLALQKAIALDSMSPPVLAARASALERPGMNPVWLRQAAAIDPRSADIQHSLGLTLRLFDDAAGAEAAFRKAVELEPERAISLLNLGQTLATARRFEEARRWLDSAITFRPEAPFYYANLGFTLLQLRDTARARVMAHETERRGARGSAELIRAHLDLIAGDTAGARARLRTLVDAMRSRDCESNHECLELAFTLGAAGETEQALSLIDRFRGGGPWLAYWLTRPEFDVLAKEPRYQSALAQARTELERLKRNP